MDSGNLQGRIARDESSAAFPGSTAVSSREAAHRDLKPDRESGQSAAGERRRGTPLPPSGRPRTGSATRREPRTAGGGSVAAYTFPEEECRTRVGPGGRQDTLEWAQTGIVLQE